MKAVITYGSAKTVSWSLYEDGAAIKSGTATSPNTTIDLGYDLSGSIAGRTLKVIVKDSNGAEASKSCKVTVSSDGKTKKCN